MQASLDKYAPLRQKRHFYRWCDPRDPRTRKTDPIWMDRPDLAGQFAVAVYAHPRYVDESHVIRPHAEAFMLEYFLVEVPYQHEHQKTGISLEVEMLKYPGLFLKRLELAPYERFIPRDMLKEPCGA